jgi:hypothetical protein
MLTAHQLENFIDEHSQIGRKVIQERAAWLRTLTLIPSGGRGLHAPVMGAGEAALLLIACCIERAKLTDDKPLREYISLRSVVTGDVWFGRVLAELMMAPSSMTSAVREVRMLKDWPRARIIYRDNNQLDYLPRKLVSEADIIHNELVLPIGFLRKLGAALADTAVEPEVEDDRGAAVA